MKPSNTDSFEPVLLFRCSSAVEIATVKNTLDSIGFDEFCPPPYPYHNALVVVYVVSHMFFVYVTSHRASGGYWFTRRGTLYEGPLDDPDQIQGAINLLTLTVT